MERLPHRFHNKYRKIPKISPGAYIFQRPFLRGLSTEGNLRFKIDWAFQVPGGTFTWRGLFSEFYGNRTALKV